MRCCQYVAKTVPVTYDSVVEANLIDGVGSGISVDFQFYMVWASLDSKTNSVYNSSVSWHLKVPYIKLA
jgi:hypothetical protein